MTTNHQSEDLAATHAYNEETPKFYYLPPTEGRMKELWGRLSDDAKTVLEKAHKNHNRPFPWNEDDGDSDHFAKLEKISPYEIQSYCRYQGVKISIEEWLIFCQIVHNFDYWPHFHECNVQMIRCAYKILKPKSVLSIGTFSMIPGGTLVSGMGASNHKVVSTNPSRFDWLKNCIDIKDFKEVYQSPEEINGEDETFDFVISNTLINETHFRTYGGEPPFLEEFSAPQSKFERLQLDIISKTRPGGFAICETKSELFSDERYIKEIEKRGFAVVGMVEFLFHSPPWAIISRSSPSSIYSIIINDSNGKDRLTSSCQRGLDFPNQQILESFLRFVFGQSETAPQGTISTPKNLFLSPLASKEIKEYTELAQRCGQPLVRPSLETSAPLPALLILEYWKAQSEYNIIESSGYEELAQTAETEELRRFLGIWFQSPLGLRYSAILKMSGCLSWPADRLPPIPLPDQLTRQGILELMTNLDELEVSTARLRDAVWKKPGLIKEHKRNYASINVPAENPAWVDVLPFPLATILWQVHTAPRAKDRLDLLLKFFEGLSSLHASILLSVAVGDSVLLDVLRQALPELRERGCDIKRATFGTWVQLYERLSKHFRAMLDQGKAPEDGAGLGRLFAINDVSVIRKLISKDLSSVFQKANHMRNRISGHGPMITENLAAVHVKELQDLIISWRASSGALWDEVKLIQSTDQMIRKGGFYHLKARVLTGVRQPFPVETLALNDAPDAEWLHLHQIGSPNTMPLLPFIQISDPPSGTQAACYFYNRCERDGAHFVSFNYEETPELTFASDPTVILMAKIG
jgi:hypothetical protein